MQVCAFAARDEERGEVAVEYEGELIDSEKARDRKKRYKDEQRMCTMML